MNIKIIDIWIFIIISLLCFGSSGVLLSNDISKISPKCFVHLDGNAEFLMGVSEKSKLALKFLWIP